MNYDFCFIENLNANSWPAIQKIILKSSVSNVFYLDSDSAGDQIAKNNNFEKLNFRFYTLKDVDGNQRSLTISYNDAIQVHKDILSEPIFKTAMQELNDPSARLYLARQAVYTGAKNIADTLALFYVIHNKSNGNNSLLIADHRLWKEVYKKFASGLNICIQYASLPKSGKTKLIKNTLILNFKNVLKSLLFTRKTKNNIQIGVEHYGQCNFNNPELFSDEFFLEEKKLSPQSVSVIFSNHADPLDEQMFTEISNVGASMVVCSAQATTVKGIKPYIHIPSKIIVPNLKLTGHKSHESISLQNEFFTYCKSKQYWVDFFQNYGIKMFISWYRMNAYHIPITAALKELGGISTYYQRGLEFTPLLETITSTDVLFGFNPYLAQSMKAYLSNIPFCVTVGYTGAHRFPLLKVSAKNFKSSLQSNGAKFIFGFMDENSHADSRWGSGHGPTQENYAFILNKVLYDPDLGLIIKPKVPKTLRQRLGPIAELLLAAEKTGRCMLIEQGTLQSSHPPSLAAAASDIMIHANLCAGTAALESALTGTPTLLLDREGWPSCPLYKLGDKVVFSNLESMWHGIEEYRKTKIKNFGDWSEMLHELDPFQDGLAAKRVGTYLLNILNGLKRGGTREEVLGDVADMYKNQWGSDKVIDATNLNMFKI